MDVAVLGASRVERLTTPGGHYGRAGGKQTAAPWRQGRHQRTDQIAPMAGKQAETIGKTIRPVDTFLGLLPVKGLEFMSREVRRVPADWKHPRESGRSDMYRPLFEGPWETDAAEWDREAALFAEGKGPDGEPLSEAAKGYAFVDWHGERPEQADYMPTWPDEARTHWQMYETTTEGTPISPVCDSPENLARWLADNNASTFASATTDYDTWLRMIGHGQSVGSCLIIGGQMISGVDAAASDI